MLARLKQDTKIVAENCKNVIIYIPKIAHLLRDANE